MFGFPVKRSLRTKLLFSHLAGVLLAVVFGALVSYHIMYGAQSALQREKLEISARQTARHLADFIQEKKQLLTWLDLGNYHRNFRDQMLAKRFAIYQSTFPVMSYASEGGREELKVVRGKMVPVTSLGNVGHTLLFRRALAHPNEVMVSPELVHLDPEGPALQLAICRVGYFGDEYLGTILASLPLAQLNQHDFSPENEEKLALVEKTGAILLPRAAGGEKVLFQGEKNGRDAALPLHSLGSGVVFGRESFLVASPVPDLDWAVVAILPREEFMAPLHRLTSWIGFKAFLAILVGSLLSLSLTRRITENLAKLQDHTKRVGQGDLTRELHVCSGDELEELAHSFNQMTADIRQAQQTRDSLTRILQSIMDPLLITDQHGKIVKLNPSALRLFACPEEQLLQRPLHSLFGVTDISLKAAALKPLLKSHPIIDLETAVRKKKDTLVPVLFSCSLIDQQDPGESGIVCILKDISHRKRTEQRIEQLAYQDTLTGLPNRHFLLRHLEELIARQREGDEPLFLLFLDLDDFKIVNDTLGHSAGDQVLQSAVKRLQGCVRKTDKICRQGGDEFIIILARTCSPEEAALVARKIITALSQPFIIDQHEFLLSASIGISSYPKDGSSAETLLKQADLAMYQAKGQKNTFRFFSPEMQDNISERLLLGKNLRLALEREEFTLHFQQKICAADGSICGIEALIRWRHPAQGLVPPAVFIPAAEETGLIIPMGEWVLREACRQNKRWQEMGFPPVCIAVNLSSRQLTAEFTVILERILQETGLDPRWLELEITENTLMENVECTRRSLQRVKELGVQIAIDDFGMGYSSLNYLCLFPIDRVKIDRVFVQDIGTGTLIAEAVIALAHSLRLQVTAEGVETEEQAAFLQANRCDEMQGFLFGKPVTAEEFTALLQRQARLAS